MSSRSGSALARKILEEPFFPAVLPAALPSVLPRPPVGPCGRKTPTESMEATERASENSVFVLPAGLHRGWKPDSTPGAATPGVWGLARLYGRLVELSGGAASAALTTAVGLVREAQLEGEPTAWITEKQSGFFPPDVRDSGVDLEALVVVRLEALAEGPRAADMLLRSGGFGLVVADLGPGCVSGRASDAGRARARGRAARGAGLSWMTTAVQARLAGLAPEAPGCAGPDHGRAAASSASAASAFPGHVFSGAGISGAGTFGVVVSGPVDFTPGGGVS